MGRAKSDFLKAFGVTFEILKALVNEVMGLGGTDDDIRQILTNDSLRFEIARLIVASGSGKPASSWVLDWHPVQKDGGLIGGYELDRWYASSQFASRHYSLESPIVRNWRANPETYPDELKGKRVYLWGSRRRVGSSHLVACLCFKDSKVILTFEDISILDSGSPALLAGTPAS